MMLLTSVLVPFAMASRLERLSAVLGALEEYLGNRNARFSPPAPTCENSVNGVDEQGNICKWSEEQMGGPGLPYCDAWADLGWCGNPEQLNMNTCCRKSCGLPPCIAVLPAPAPAPAPILPEPPISAPAPNPPISAPAPPAPAPAPPAPAPAKKEGESCGSCFSPDNNFHCGDCDTGLECKCVGPCADPLLADAPSTCVKSVTDSADDDGEDTGGDDDDEDCFVYGATYSDRTVAPSSVEASPDDCQARCSSVDGCSYFTFKTGSGRCYLSGEDATLNALSAGKAHKAIAGPTVCAPPVCCMAVTAACEACKDQITIEEFCEDNPNFDGCSVVLSGTQTTTTVPIITPPPADCENSVNGVDELGNICKWTEEQMGGPGLPYCDAWADLGWCGNPEQLNMNTCCRKSCGTCTGMQPLGRAARMLNALAHLGRNVGPPPPPPDFTIEDEYNW